MIELSNVSIRAGEFELSKMAFRIESGQYAVIMGQTGIGKTTILEAICGLRSVVKGRVLVDGINVTDWPPGDRDMGYVPQDHALFPTLKVRDQISFALKLRGRSRKECERRSDELSELLSIRHLLDRRISGLSGGEAQRVALGRALSFQPRGLLLDEPLSALDDDTRIAAQDLLRDINQATGVTVLHVTHNATEAAALGDRQLLLSRGSENGTVLLRDRSLADQDSE